MTRPPIDVNKLAARAQGAARALNPPERQASEAITRRATRGGPTIRVEGTTGVVPSSRLELPGSLSQETADRNSSATDTGANPGAPVFDLLIVVARSIRYKSITRTMTAKEVALAKRIIDQFPGMMRVATNGRFGVRVRYVIQEELWNLDAAIAAGGSDAEPYASPPGNYGYWINGSTSRSITDQYGGQTYECRAMIVGRTQFDPGSFGLSRGTYSFVNVADSFYDDDKANNRVTDILVHEFLHQITTLAEADGGSTLNLHGQETYGFTQPPYGPTNPRNFMDWYVYYVANSNLTSMRDDNIVPTIDPRTAPVSLNFIDIDNSWSGLTTPPTNSTDAELRNRATHTGTQPISTVAGLQAALDASSPAAFQAFYGSADWINVAMSLPTTLTARSAVTIPANTLVGVPIRFSRSRTVDRLSIYVNTAVAGNLRLGLARIGDDGFATSLLVDAGTVSTSTVGARTLTVSVAVTPGWYLVWVISSVAVSVSGLVNSAFLASPWDALGTGGESVAVGSTPVRRIFYSAARAYGVLPATLTMAGNQLTDAAVPVLSVRSS